MKTSQTHTSHTGKTNRDSISRSAGSTPSFAITLGLLKQLWLGLQHLFVVIKYLVFAFRKQITGKTSSPAFKLGILALVALFVFGRDEALNINLGLPKWLSNKEKNTSEFSIAQPLALSTTAPAPAQKKVSNTAPKKSSGPALLNEDAIRAYIKRFRKVAIAEQELFGIPASIKLAQGILESHAGQSKAALELNNHFGAATQSIPVATAWENWRAHSILLQEKYPKLFKLGNNPNKWANGLEKMGYNGDSNYGEKLMQIIEWYQLSELN
jgi:flagellum-specific peptidoglycan hydrolase FlgJ